MGCLQCTLYEILIYIQSDCVVQFSFVRIMDEKVWIFISWLHKKSTADDLDQ